MLCSWGRVGHMDQGWVPYWESLTSPWLPDVETHLSICGSDKHTAYWCQNEQHTYSCNKISFSQELKLWCEVWADALLNCDAVNPGENLCSWVLANTDLVLHQLDYLSQLLLTLREWALHVLPFKGARSPPYIDSLVCFYSRTAPYSL